MPRAKSKLATITEIDQQPNEETQHEELELEAFLNGLGPEGMSEVSLYRLGHNGRQKFITSGPPGQFSEQYVQTTYGGGDYMVRAKLNGRWYRSKSFAVEGEPGSGNNTTNGHAEIDRLKLEIEKQQLRLHEQEATLAADRAQREQRAHETQLALIEGRTGTVGGTSITDIIAAVKTLKELSGKDDTLGELDKMLSIVDRLNGLRGGGGKEEGFLDWLKPIAVDAGRAAIPFIVPWLQRAAAGRTPPAPTPNPAPQPAPTAAAIHEGTPPTAGSSDRQPSPPGPESQPDITAQDLDTLKRQAIAYILPIAQANRDPAVYVDMAIEQVEVQANPVIAQFLDEILRAENFDPWFRGLQTLEPTIITQRAWLAAFFDIMRETLQRSPNEGATHEQAGKPS